MFTRLTWEVLTEPINFVPFILRAILSESGIVTFFGFYSICPFVTRSFWSHFTALLVVRESKKYSTSGLISRSNSSMVSHRGKGNEDHKNHNNIPSPEKRMSLSMWKGESESVCFAAKPAEERRKVTRWRHASSAVCAKLHFAEQCATICTTIKPSNSL